MTDTITDAEMVAALAAAVQDSRDDPRARPTMMRHWCTTGEDALSTARPAFRPAMPTFAPMPPATAATQHDSDDAAEEAAANADIARLEQRQRQRGSFGASLQLGADFVPSAASLSMGVRATDAPPTASTSIDAVGNNLMRALNLNSDDDRTEGSLVDTDSESSADDDDDDGGGGGRTRRRPAAARKRYATGARPCFLCEYTGARVPGNLMDTLLHLWADAMNSAVDPVKVAHDAARVQYEQMVRPRRLAGDWSVPALTAWTFLRHWLVCVADPASEQFRQKMVLKRIQLRVESAMMTSDALEPGLMQLYMRLLKTSEAMNKTAVAVNSVVRPDMTHVRTMTYMLGRAVSRPGNPFRRRRQLQQQRSAGQRSARSSSSRSSSGGGGGGGGIYDRSQWDRRRRQRQQRASVRATADSLSSSAAQRRQSVDN